MSKLREARSRRRMGMEYQEQFDIVQKAVMGYIRFELCDVRADFDGFIARKGRCFNLT